MIKVATTTLELNVKDVSNPIHIPAQKAKRPKVVTKGERDAANAKAFKADQLTHLIKKLKEIEGIKILAFDTKDSLENQHDVILTKLVTRITQHILNQNGFNPYNRTLSEKMNLIVYID